MDTAHIEDIYELSPTQQGMLFHSLYAPQTGIYIGQLTCCLEGDLDPIALEKAWQFVTNQHPILRTAFQWEGLEKPLQIVYRQVDVSIEYKDWQSLSHQQQELETYLAQERQRDFDLAKAPLMRLTLIRLSQQQYQFVWTKHHILLDGWSKTLVLKHVLQAYEAFALNQTLPPITTRPYSDYIGWLQQQDLASAEAFWRQTLAGFTAPTPLGVDHNVTLPTNQTQQEQTLQLSSSTTSALHSLARNHQLTLNTIIQGAWAILLSRYSGDQEVVFGATGSGRPASLPGSESMVGLFINTLPARVQVPETESLIPWLQQLQEQQAQARQYEYTPLVKIKEWSDVPTDLPLFENILVFENYPVDASLQQLNDHLGVRSVQNFDKTNYPLTALVIPDSELTITIAYDEQRFDQDAITRLCGHLETLLEGMVANPQRQVAELPLLTAEERHQILVNWNNTQLDYPDQCIHQLVEAQVERTPDAISVIFENEQLTYQELNQRANQLAHYLQNLGVEPEQPVGICLVRSVDLIVALLGTLKAGGAYVPLDPDYPQQRLAFMCSDAQLKVVVTQNSLRSLLPDYQGSIICLDSSREHLSQEPISNPCPQTTLENLAYVIYTSGSTGTPKGVMNNHRGVSNRLLWMQDAYGLTANDRVLQKTPFSFDVSVWEFFWPLVTGACLVFAEPDGHKDPSYLRQLITEQEITTIHFVPSMLGIFLEETEAQACQSLQRVICSGEALPFSLQERFFQCLDAELHNLYGPTEAAIDVTAWQCHSQYQENIVPIGFPIANTEVYILNAYQQPVPIGVSGELYIGGTCLARGYFNRPELTAERFLPHPFSQKLGMRLYRTGDWVRYCRNGQIEYLGRIDNQVKLRGFRIELEEIEAILTQHPALDRAVVSAPFDDQHNRYLVGYLVPNSEQTLTSDEVYHYLQSRLPAYMIPNQFVFLQTLPLTPNGKIDRNALPEPDLSSPYEETRVMPRTATEKMLAEIWCEILACDKVGINENFFQLGGHSLKATQVISKVRDRFQIELPLKSLFESPTIAGLADKIETKKRATQQWEAPPILPVSRDQKLPLSFAQKRLWFLEQLETNSAAYNIPIAVRLTGSLNITALEQSLNQIVQRHEVLRTTFPLVDGEPIQQITPTWTFKLPMVDLQELSEAQQQTEVVRLATQQAQQPFDLTQGPLLRSRLLKLSEFEHVALFTMHHIISDGWSMGILIEELTTLYEAFSKGKSSPLPELPIQYGDFAYWQHQWLQGEVLENQLSYWQKQLAGAPRTLDLNKIEERSLLPTQKEQEPLQPLQLSAEVSEQLWQLSSQEGVTLFMILLAAFNTLLYRYTNQDDIVVGTDVANRNKAEIEPLIGFFVNLLVLRTDMSGNPTFRELLERVREVTVGAYDHQDLPFAKLVEALQPERSSSKTPLFQVLFVLQNATNSELKLSDVTVSPLDIDTGEAKFELALFLKETEQGIFGNWKYNTDLFSSSTINRLSRHFETLINSAVASPDTRINALEILTETEKKQQMMEQQKREQSRFKKFKSVKPKAVSLPTGQLIKTDYLHSAITFPLVIQPNINDLELIDWAKNSREFLETKLLQHGAILFRNFNIDSVSAFESLAEAICPNLFGEYGDLPREGISDKVYGSTPYPSDKAILFHNESSHLNQWPLKIWFFCVQPAQTGGETPIVDCRKAYQLLDPKLREKLEQRQLMYVRNYIEGLDVSWQEFFRTSDKTVVENYCHQAGMDFEWLSENSLRTRQVRPAVSKHPKTEEPVLFNQVQLHHISCLEPAVRESLLSTFGEERLPRNVYYGDGSPIEESVIEEIGKVYEQAKVSFPWQQGDVLMLDNMLTAHGRNPYKGSRKIVVAMGEIITNNNY